MQTPSTSICSAANAAVVLIPSLLRHLSFRMANSSEELLDLFEERYGVSQGRAVETVSDAAASFGSSSRAWH